MAIVELELINDDLVTDLGYWVGPSCSERRCPSDGPAWFDVASGDDVAHGRAECGGNGHCDRQTGSCSCRSEFRPRGAGEFGALGGRGEAELFSNARGETRAVRFGSLSSWRIALEAQSSSSPPSGTFTITVAMGSTKEDK